MCWPRPPWSNAPASRAGGRPFLTYGFTQPEEVPAFAAVGGEVKVTVTGSAHDQQGRLRKNAPEVIEVLRHLERKIEAHAETMALVRPDLDPGAPHLVISYGITARAARQAVAALRREGVRVSLLQPQTLFPIPRRALDGALAGVRTVFVAEENLTGQYRTVLPPRSVALTTDIGCVGLADSLFPFLHTVHTTHGRSTAFATGMALAEVVLEPSGLKPVVMIGDGGAMIGLLHLVHAAQLNVDVTVLLHNNFLFGMTGGQHSALTPLSFTTATTPGGNWTPPLDLVALLRAAHAGFLARQFATDTTLDAVIAEAIAYPGFALVEILELCTAYGTRWNQLTGSALKEIVARQGYQIGRLDAETARPTLRELYRRERPSRPARAAAPTADQPTALSTLAQEVRLVVAGSAGERVQSAAALFCRAALAAGR